jgi:transcriptional regulator with XRE-family HTH domain
MNTAGLLIGFGSVLERYRHKRALTIERLEDASGIPAVLIKCFETADYTPTLIDFFRIAGALDVPPCTLLNDVLVQWKSNPTDF